MNEVNSKQPQLPRSVIKFQGKVRVFKEFQVPLKRHFKFQHFSRSLGICTDLDLALSINAENLYELLISRLSKFENSQFLL